MLKLQRIYLLILVFFIQIPVCNAFPIVDAAKNLQKTIDTIEQKVKSIKGIQQVVTLLQNLAQIQSMYKNAVAAFQNVANFVERIRSFNPKKFFDDIKHLRLSDGTLFTALGIQRDPDSPIYKLNQSIFNPLNDQLSNLNQSMDILERYDAADFLRNVMTPKTTTTVNIAPNPNEPKEIEHTNLDGNSVQGKLARDAAFQSEVSRNLNAEFEYLSEFIKNNAKRKDDPAIELEKLLLHQKKLEMMTYLSRSEISSDMSDLAASEAINQYLQARLRDSAGDREFERLMRDD